VLSQRQLDIGLLSSFGPREARPKRRKIVPRAERFFALIEFKLVKFILMDVGAQSAPTFIKIIDRTLATLA
jgi:hypothetical protein